MFKVIFSICRKICSVLNGLRKILLNLLFFGFLLFIIVVSSQEEEAIVVPENAALILNITGDIVEQKSHVSPADAFMQEALNEPEENPEVLLSDIIKVVHHAANDNRINTIILKLSKLKGASLTQLADIAEALKAFKATDKKVIATGSQYTQSHYYLASFADEVWLDPKGWMLLEGYGRYQLYFKSALEKLKVSPHIFRVGTYKSAVEPYLRDDMSDAAKEANALWLNDLWNQYKLTVATQRGFSIENFDEQAKDLVTKLAEADGSMAQYALNNGWIDAIKTRTQAKQALIEIVGKNDKEKYNRIKFDQYLSMLTPAIPFSNLHADKVAIIVAKGTILDGTQNPGKIGGDSTAKLLRKARYNDDVKAVVLRVDSPGGSAFASEIIRREIQLIKKSGKPVIASMGTYAASGGYWISAEADKIIASPSTITGSIGIFGMFMTFENTLSELGIHTDGVGTTDLSGFGVTRPLSKSVGDIFQLTIERGYKDFISLVAKNRDMTLAEVDAIAQGRVWSGAKAKALGLVDELGNLDDAINEAVRMAGLDNYEVLNIEKELSGKDLFFKKLFAQSSSLLGTDITPSQSVISPVHHLQNKLEKTIQQVNSFNDPQGIYALCIACETY